MPRCRSCKAEVVFARHYMTGRAQPLELDPGGAFVLTGDGGYEPFQPLIRPDHRELPRYASHFATCPEADGWRGSRS